MNQKNKDIIAPKSTKDTILEKSLEMINDGGMMDFRIDVLALSLNLSPGNITYHFAKKEDISSLLWQKFIEELEGIKSCISNILDIKQTYLIFREYSSIVYKIRGLAMFVGSDSRVLRDKRYTKTNFYTLSYELLKNITELLYLNGYLYYGAKENDLVSQSLIMRWSINKSAISQSVEKLPVNQIINQNALLMLFAFYNQMNDVAKAEFDYILKRVGEKDI
ncbi:MAG: TetR/AcrR family transcriptional regulator [Rikenellaceae bacterium]